MNGIIYKVTNKVNGKIYIGQTIRNISERMGEHIRHHDTYFDVAIDKYGIDSFDVSIIDFSSDTDELNKKERHWIAFFNSLAPNGYNLCEGGGVTNGFHHKEESKQKMSASKNGIYMGENNPFYGKHHSKEQTEKWSKTRKYSGTWTARKVICIETGEVFDCMQRAADKYNLKATHIGRVCRGVRKTTGGFHWKYAE